MLDAEHLYRTTADCCRVIKAQSPWLQVGSTLVTYKSAGGGRLVWNSHLHLPSSLFILPGFPLSRQYSPESASSMNHCMLVSALLLEDLTETPFQKGCALLPPPHLGTGVPWLSVHLCNRPFPMGIPSQAIGCVKKNEITICV